MERNPNAGEYIMEVGLMRRCRSQKKILATTSMATAARQSVLTYKTLMGCIYRESCGSNK